MSDEQKPGSDRATLAPREHEAPSRIDRRRFFRGAAALTVGSLGAPAALAQVAAPQADSNARTGSANEQLEAQTRRVLRWAGRDPADWVRARAGVDHNVVIVGGGQSGVAIAYGLRRKGVGRVDVIDQAEPGQAGIWRTIARMHQLRTPKTMTGPGARQRRAGFSRVVRNPERPGGVRCAGPDSAARVGRLPGLVPANHGDEGPLPHATARDRAAGRRAALAPRDRRRAARRDDAQARARERLCRRRRTQRARFHPRAAGQGLDAHDRPTAGRNVQGQGHRRGRRRLIGVRRGGEWRSKPARRKCISSAGAPTSTTRRLPRRHRPLNLLRHRPTVATRTCSSSRTSCPTSCAGATTSSANDASRRCRSIRCNARWRSKDFTSI